LCTNVNLAYEWVGPTNFVVNTTTNGEFNTGKYTQFCDWNRLVSSSTSGGTNTPNGSQIVNYDISTNVNLKANSGNYIDYYVLTTTDNTGLVSVVTNDFSGTGVTNTNVPIDHLKGSNSIYTVYGTQPSLRTVTATAPTWANVSPPGNTNYYSTNIPYGTSQTFSVSPGEVIINNGLRRERITGLRIVEK
jgi:hypothetical protein